LKPSQENPFKELKRFQKDNDLCMKCGFCMGACPTYREELVEASVARGRNALAKALVKGEVDFTPELAERLDKCTLCKSCTFVCPAHVDIPSVVIAARADEFRKSGLKFPYNIAYRSILPRRVLFGRVVKFAGLAQKLFFPKAEGTMRHLPNFMEGLLHNKGRRIPQVASKFLRQSVPVVNSPPPGTPTKFRVGYMTGCITDYVYPELGKKVIDFLTRHGVEVIVPREQGCCGAPVYMGAGDFDTGRKMADTNVAAFKNLDYIIVDCATCGSSMKDYVKYLADTPEHTKAYTDFGNRVMHITSFLVDVLKLPDSAYKVAPEFKGKTVTWHDPCHLVRHLGVKDAPRQILRAMKDIKYIEMAEADKCCGMAGGFSLHHYELSSKIADRKYQNIADSQADIVVTGCPGCEIQIKDTLARHGSKAQVLNIMELLE
jgi:glycolate oxidase iron-sulfur subunit